MWTPGNRININAGINEAVKVTFAFHKQRDISWICEYVELASQDGLLSTESVCQDEYNCLEIEVQQNNLNNSVPATKKTLHLHYK
jgi:hypothetical protein